MGLSSAQSRRASPDDRRFQILEAAEHVLVERGVDASMAEIAEAAGIAKGTVYLYFESKAELLSSLRTRYLEQFAATAGAALHAERPQDCPCAVELFAAILFDWSTSTWRLHHVLFKESGAQEDDALACGRAQLLDLIHDGLARGEIAVSDPELCARALFDAIHSLLIATMCEAEPDPTRFDAAVHELVPRVLGAR